MHADGTTSSSFPGDPGLARFHDGFDFEARVFQADGAVVVAVAGEIDMATAELFRQAVEDACARDSRVMVDLAGTTFIDSTGLAVLIRAQRQLRPRSGTIVVLASHAQIRRTFEISGGAFSSSLNGNASNGMYQRTESGTFGSSPGTRTE